MDYRYVKAFKITAEQMSFSKAAQRLNIAQSAVSRQIKLLEESLGTELIIRSSKKVILTDKGKQLYLAIQHFDQISSEIFEKDEDRPINIGVLHGLLENWFGQIIVEYYKRHDRNLNIHVDNPEKLKKHLAEGRFDIIFTTENIQSEIISSLKLFNENLTLISKEIIDLNKLHSYRWITYHMGDNLYQISKRYSNRIIVVDSITTIINLVRNGVGIALVPDHVLKKKEHIHCYSPKNCPNSEIFMSTLNYKTYPRPINELIHIIKEHLPGQEEEMPQ